MIRRIRLPLQIVKFTTTLQLLTSLLDYLKAGVWNIWSASEIKYSSLTGKSYVYYNKTTLQLHLTMWAKVRSTRYSSLAIMNLPFLIPVYVFHLKCRHPVPTHDFTEWIKLKWCLNINIYLWKTAKVKSTWCREKRFHFSLAENAISLGGPQGCVLGPSSFVFVQPSAAAVVYTYGTCIWWW